MKDSPLYWIASYPRSGNTFLRTIIYNCFGVKSASIYPKDLADGVAKIVGHIEHTPDHSIDFGDEPVHLLKTHLPPQNDRPAIYVVRDGRAATTSLHAFWKGRSSLKDIIEGKNVFGTWSRSLSAWDPVNRPNTLLLRYEDFVRDTRGTVDRLAEHLKLQPKGYAVPSRDDMARADGMWIRASGSEHIAYSPEEEARFWEINGEMMRRYGYER